MTYSLPLVFLAGAAFLKAAPTPASPFQDSMVLQWGKPVPVWGSAPVGEEVSVTINGQSSTAVTGEDGKWITYLPALASGGPHTLNISGGGTSVTIDDVLIGDVWVVCGQSNMKRPPLSTVVGGADYIDAIQDNDLPVRCLEVAERVATSPQDEGEMNWLTKSTAGNWSAVGTIFASELHEATGRPVGILWTAWGSTQIEAWMPREMTADLPHFAAEITDFEANDEATVTGMLDGSITYDANYLRALPHIAYNQMINPLLPFGISGFLWYQGESNADTIEEVAQYRFTLPLFVQKYQELFQQGELPFLTVQLPSYNFSTWPWFRESQTFVTEAPNTHLSINLDLGLATNIHPLDKVPVGQRLALLARKHAYGEDIVADSPVFESMTISGAQATITFANNTGISTSDGQQAAQFELAGDDQVFYPSTRTTILRGGLVRVESSEVPTPVAVRYAWNPILAYQLNLVNSAGLPAAPFRTDSWPLPGLGARAPLAVSDTYSTSASQSLSITAGVLENDIDLNRDSLSAELIDDVTNGTLDFQPDGSFTYLPNPEFIGTDSFTYRANDGSLVSDPATVSFNVIQSGFLSWSTSITWPSSEASSPDADPDADGQNNFMEYALGLDPLDATSVDFPTLSKDGDQFSFTFNNSRSGVIYEVLLSNDLQNWESEPFATLSNEDSTPVTIPAPSETDSRLFVRLRVHE